MFTASWYGDKRIRLSFPENWDVKLCAPRGARALTEKELNDALHSPIGGKSLKELAKGKSKVVILVDDLTRPTPTYKLMPHILRELKEGGVSLNRILILAALGTHRPLTRFDFEKKVGKKVVESVETLNHMPYENCVYLGESHEGTPIYINKFVVDADLKIGIGGIIPYPPTGPGFHGGAKIIVPGVSGIKTISHHHTIPGGDPGSYEGNRMRKNIEEISVNVGLDTIVNVTINEKRDITGLFTGDVVEAYREGMNFARKIYYVGSPGKADIAVINAYPFDTSLLQAAGSLYLGEMATDPEGIIVLYSDCSEGRGFHTLSGKGGRFYKPPESDNEEGPRTVLQQKSGKRVIVCSPNLTKYDVCAHLGPNVSLFKSWNEVIEKLKDEIGDDASAVIFPHDLSLVKLK